MEKCEEQSFADKVLLNFGFVCVVPTFFQHENQSFLHPILWLLCTKDSYSYIDYHAWKSLQSVKVHAFLYANLYTEVGLNAILRSMVCPQ